MQELERRLDNLRERLETTSQNDDTSQLERDAYELLGDAKNTKYETEAQELFTQVASLQQQGTGNTPSVADTAPIRALLRRARIRIEIAGDDEDIDEAIDILAQAVALDPNNKDVHELLQQAAVHNDHSRMRVQEILARYNIEPQTQTKQPGTLSEDSEIEGGTTSTDGSTREPPYERAWLADAESQSRGSAFVRNQTLADNLNRLSESYYAGDYKETVSIANKILSDYPGNPTAQDYRQKAEENLIRGVVPDNRIPFEARVAYNRANSLVRAGNYEDAQQLYNQARALAEKGGIENWQNVEQALLDIQDFTLARELLDEADRLVAADRWADALQKYEGALRVIPNDPLVEERITDLRNLQDETDQIAVQLNMLTGPIEEQVAQIQELRMKITQLRQKAPGSKRMEELQHSLVSSLDGVKRQLIERANSGLSRARNIASVDEQLKINNEALGYMEMAVELDPGDSEALDLFMRARAGVTEMSNAHQTIEKASQLIAQNYDADLAQARTLLASLTSYTQDDRYRMVVGDLLARYMERAELALEEGNISEAQSWLDGMREEPFRVLGRRTELYRLENEIKRKKSRRRLWRFIIIIGIIIILLLILLFTRDRWQPVIASLVPEDTPTPTLTYTPSVTNTPTMTYTPSITPTPSDTPTPSATPTASDTPTETPTSTPSSTPTASLTPTATNTTTSTPTLSPTPTFTYTPSETFTATLTATVTSTPPGLCIIEASNEEGINIRSRPTTVAQRLAILDLGQRMEVLEQQRQLGIAFGPVWYRVRVFVGEQQIVGWVREDTVEQITRCPDLPES